LASYEHNRDKHRSVGGWLDGEKLLYAVGLIQVRYPAMPCGIANFNGS
jgi:hypothetical protein